MSSKVAGYRALGIAIMPVPDQDNAKWEYRVAKLLPASHQMSQISYPAGYSE